LSLPECRGDPFLRAIVEAILQGGYAIIERSSAKDTGGLVLRCETTDPARLASGLLLVSQEYRGDSHQEKAVRHVNAYHGDAVSCLAQDLARVLSDWRRPGTRAEALPKEGVRSPHPS
jgi:hypothetical protein